jgi:23S rRNA pseudouridine2605 synthase
MGERLQRTLAQAGYGSRRSCEQLILDGRVTVNGQIPQLGHKVDPLRDEIRVDGEVVRPKQARLYIALNKPPGVVCSLRAQGARQTVTDIVDVPERVYPVGRLDVESEGLVLLTNDGDLTNKLTHPRYGHEKEYRIQLRRPPAMKQISAIRRGVVLKDGVKTIPARAWLEDGTNSTWLRIVLKQGRKRQIRETLRVLGLSVRRLIRIRIASIKLGNLQPGKWRHLNAAEVAELHSLTASPKKNGRRQRGRKRRGSRASKP